MREFTLICDECSMVHTVEDVFEPDECPECGDDRFRIATDEELAEIERDRWQSGEAHDPYRFVQEREEGAW